MTLLQIIYQDVLGYKEKNTKRNKGFDHDNLCFSSFVISLLLGQPFVQS